jgi:pyruvate-formate lyase
MLQNNLREEIMQSSEVRTLVAGKRLPWESSELIALKIIKNRLYSFYSLTEGNLDNMDKTSILRQIKALSDNLEDLIRYVDSNIDKLIERDVRGNKVCKFCEDKRVYVCEPCMDGWAKELDEKMARDALGFDETMENLNDLRIGK